MPRGRRPKYAGPEESRQARRERRRIQAQYGRPSQPAQSFQPWSALRFPGEMVWDATAPPRLPSLEDEGPQLDIILTSTENGLNDSHLTDANHADDCPLYIDNVVLNEGADVFPTYQATPQRIPRSPYRSPNPLSLLSPEASPSRQRSRTSPASTSSSQRRRRHASHSTSAEADVPAPVILPPTPLAQFLAIQFLSPDPAQTLLSYARPAPNIPPNLLHGLEQHHDLAETPHPDDCISLAGGLEHIASHYAADHQLPDMISQPSIQQPSVRYDREAMQYLFTGYTCDADRPLRPRIDPLVDSQTDYQVTAEFDIDSLIIPSNHLGLFRQGLLWYPTQMPMGAVTTSMHMKTMSVRFTDPHGHVHQQRVPLHHVPNYCFARLPGADGITVHWFFRQLYEHSDVSVAQKNGQRLTDFHFARWTNRILLPSLRECLPAGRLQHLPSSFEHAQANSRAFHRETRATDINTGAHHQNLQYEIPAQYLPAIQDAITRRLQLPGHAVFRDAQLMVVGKGLKLQPWKTPHLTSTVDYFLSWMDRFFDPQYLCEDTVHVDIGKETIPTSPSTLLWREDFLRLFASCLQTCAEEQSTLKPTLYPWGFVRGVGSGTLETPLESPLRDQGLSFYQHYPSVKEIKAAGNTYTFSNEHMSNITLNKDVLTTFQQIGGAISVRPEILIRAYIHSKLRSHHGLLASSDKSYGTRWECRITLTLLRQIDLYARSTIWPDLFQVRPSCAWVAHPTTVITDWLRFHLNKFCFGFETIWGRCQEKPYIAWEHTQLMILMLKSVSCFAGVLIPGTYPQLWKDHYLPAAPRRSRNAQVVVDPEPRQGLAIGVNMQELGYGWFADKIDWEHLVLRPEVSGQFRVQQPSILSAFRANYRRLRNHMDDYILIASSGSLLSQWKASPPHVAYLLRLFRTICLRAFIQDVFQVLRPFMRPRRWSEVETGRLGLSADSLNSVMDCQRATVRIQASPYQKIRNVHGLVQWLWGDDDGFGRGPWQRLPYRMLFVFCRQLITDVLGLEHFRAWRRLFIKHVRINCWVFPYPDSKVLVSHERKVDHRVQFRWWSNYNYKLAQHHGDDPEQVIRCHLWPQWPAGRWSVTPEADFMRGILRPDLHLAFLRPDQVVVEMQELANSTDQDEQEPDEDEDGLDPDGVRDVSGARQFTTLPEANLASDDPVSSACDSDDSTLSEYQDRRRLRREEKDHVQRRRRLGFIRTSLRLEQQAYKKSIPLSRTRMTAEAADDIDVVDGPNQHDDVKDVMQRYEVRLARISMEEREHARTASRLSRRRAMGVQQARARQQERELARRQAKLERKRQRQEEEREHRLQRQLAERMRQARLEQVRVRRERQWLETARSEAGTGRRPRRILGELDTRDHPC